MSTVSAFGLSRSSSPPRAFGLPLRSKAALEQTFELELPSPPPPLRDGVTEVHYSRWMIEESNKEVGDELRSFQQDQKQYKKAQMESFLKQQHTIVEDSHQQMASASAAVETVRLKNLEIGQEMRLNLLELKQSVHLEKQVHSAKGRELVESAKHVQSAKVLEQQLSTRGKRQAMGAATKKEREALTARREANKTEEEERKRAITEQIKSETLSDVVHRSKDVIISEKTKIGNDIRDAERVAAEKRLERRNAFLQQSAEQRREVDSIKEGAKSARAGLQSARKQQADEVRQARVAERERKKALVEEMRRRNREVHDMLYAAKFAPRDRATKVQLPGRIGKVASWNAFDAEAAAQEAAAAPAAADAAPGSPGFGAPGMGLGMGGRVGGA